MTRLLPLILATIVAAPPSSGPRPTLVNWESPHVHPLEMTPSGTRLLAVNTLDNRLLGRVTSPDHR